LILLAESANRTKKGGQELIGGLDVRVNRNYFGRQIESFEAALQLPFLNQGEESDAKNEPFRGIFIRAPVVETLLSSRKLKQEAGEEEVGDDGVVRAPSRDDRRGLNDVEIMATLPGRSQALKEKPGSEGLTGESGDIVAVLQDNVFGTSFHPELTNDARIHQWWLKRVSAIGLP
jgi:5'-phosphate synthase pdxT subunit